MTKDEIAIEKAVAFLSKGPGRIVYASSLDMAAKIAAHVDGTIGRMLDFYVVFGSNRARCPFGGNNEVYGKQAQDS